MLWWIGPWYHQRARCFSKDLTPISCRAQLPTPQDFHKKACCVPLLGSLGPPCFLWIFMDLRLLDWCLFWMILKDLVCMDSNSCLTKSGILNDWCSLQIGNVTWTLENVLDIIRSPCALLNMGGYSTWRRLWHEVVITRKMLIFWRV